jgi:hypothetical protein
MSEMLNHFIREVAILRKKYKGDSLVIDPVLPEIEALIEAFGESGQSGASAALIGPVIADTIKKALAFKPLSELTGWDEEWTLVCEGQNADDNLFQNKRNSAVFKEGKEGKPYYLDGLIWLDTVSNVAWTGSVKLPDNLDLSSRVYIKDLSKFDGKSFYIKVQKDTEGSEIYVIKNPELLKEAVEIYELMVRLQ